MNKPLQFPKSEPPTHEQAEEAVRTLIAYTGDDPQREGVRDTPARVARAYLEMFEGYRIDPDAELRRTFEEVEGYDDIVLLRDIGFESHCAHHIMPFIGKAHIAYLPNGRVVGISKLARVVEVFSKRLQSQESMTTDIAGTIDRVLQPRGVAVIVEGEHFCMTMRGVRKPGVQTVTSHYLGAFRTDPQERRNLQALLPGLAA